MNPRFLATAILAMGFGGPVDPFALKYERPSRPVDPLPEGLAEKIEAARRHGEETAQRKAQEKRALRALNKGRRP